MERRSEIELGVLADWICSLAGYARCLDMLALLVAGSYARWLEMFAGWIYWLLLIGYARWLDMLRADARCRICWMCRMCSRPKYQVFKGFQKRSPKQPF